MISLFLTIAVLMVSIGGRVNFVEEKSNDAFLRAKNSALFSSPSVSYGSRWWPRRTIQNFLKVLKRDSVLEQFVSFQEFHTCILVECSIFIRWWIMTDWQVWCHLPRCLVQEVSCRWHWFTTEFRYTVRWVCDCWRYRSPIAKKRKNYGTFFT